MEKKKNVHHMCPIGLADQPLNREIFMERTGLTEKQLDKLEKKYAMPLTPKTAQPQKQPLFSKVKKFFGAKVIDLSQDNQK